MPTPMLTNDRLTYSIAQLSSRRNEELQSSGVGIEEYHILIHNASDPLCPSVPLCAPTCMYTHDDEREFTTRSVRATPTPAIAANEAPRCRDAVLFCVRT